MSNRPIRTRNGRGRKPGSIVRERIKEILYHLGEGYGYEIHNIYKEAYPKVSLRLIYYHLRRGVDEGIFKITAIKNEKGEYSWGGESEKIYYSLTKNAIIRGDEKIREIIKKKEEEKNKQTKQ